MDNKNRSFQMIADVEGDYSDLTRMEMPDTLPILAVRNLVSWCSITYFNRSRV